jgi:DNA-binding phage protein
VEIIKKFFPQIMNDNDENLFQHCASVIESVDELAKIEIIKNPHSYNFRIITSLPRYNNILIEELLKFYNQFGIHLDLSKSIKTSSTITFSIKI